MTQLLPPDSATARPVAPSRADDPAGAPRRVSPVRLLRFLAGRPGLVLSVVLVVLVLLAVFAPAVFTARDPLAAEPAVRLQGPGAHHLFGTDQLGRDMFSRVVHGASMSLRAALIAVVLGSVAGSAVGLFSGFVGGWADGLVMRVVDVFLAVPGLLLSLAFVTAIGFGTTNVAIAVGLASIAQFARLMRAEVLRVRTSVFVEAAQASGTRWYAILGRHVLPNAYGPVLAMATLQFGIAILAVSSLSFLGYGAAPPAPEWGSLVAQGRDYLATAWWLTTLPGLTVALTVLATNRIARAVDGEWAAAR
jgi:peptide/nickel transport system permease protein